MEELDQVEWTIIGLSEVRRDGEGCMMLTNGEKFFFNGSGSQGGTGFLVNTRTAKQISAFKTYSPRVSKIIWKPSISKYKGKFKLIQVYAPTSTSSEEDIEIFYNHLQTALNEDKCSHTLICGDWNSKVGKTEGEEAVGRHGLGTRNDRGNRLVEFADSNRMFIMNTFFEKPESLKWTWVSPDGKTRNEIDYFLCNRKSLINDVTVEKNINTGSDHRALKAVLNIAIKKSWQKKVPKRIITVDLLKSLNYEDILKNKLENNEKVKKNLNELETKIVCAINQSTNTVLNSEDVPKSKKIPVEIRKLMNRRRKLKRRGKEKIEFAEVSKTIRKMIKEWSDRRNIEEFGKAINEGLSLKKCMAHQKIGRMKVTAMKDRKGDIKKDTNEILDVITEYYKELYSLHVNMKNEVEPIQDNNIEGNRNHDEEGEKTILTDEIEYIIRKMKVGKTSGLDNISNEELKAGGAELTAQLRSLFNLCLKDRRIPNSWLQSKLILIFKKGDRLEINNYRPINLLSGIYKLFMSIVTTRITKQLDFHSPVSQVGFKKNYSTCDAILVIQQLLAKAEEYKFSLALLFIDFEKAFDSVYPATIVQAMHACGVDDIYVELMSYIYKNAEIHIKIENHQKSISVEKGLRQGDVPSAKLFGAVLEEVFKNLDWHCYGINVNGEKLNVIKFADDVVLIGSSKTEVMKMLNELSSNAREVGLKINMEKTKLMTVNCQENLQIENRGKIVEEVKDFIYLGQLIGVEDSISKEIKRRIGLGWRAFMKFKKLFTSNVAIDMKVKLWNAVIKPVLLYGCETWTLTKYNIEKMRVCVRGMERSMLRISRKEHKTNKWIREQTKMEDLGRNIISRKWKWAGHIIRVEDERWTRKVLNWVPLENKRKRGRPKTRWDQEMRACCGEVTWKRVAMERTEWRRMGKVYEEEWLD